MVCMNTKKPARASTPAPDTRSNDRLRALIEATDLTQAEALARFNRSIGLRPIALSTWKGYFVNPTSTRWRRFDTRLLSHAEKVFKKRRPLP
jgi:hypothetical protein